MARFEELGNEVVARESYTSDIADFRSQLTKLINAEPDGIYLAAQQEFSAGTIMKQLRELGYEGTDLRRDRCHGDLRPWKSRERRPPG